MKKEANVVMYISVSVASLIALAIIVAAIVHPYVSTEQTPAVLENWGGVIVGFYFGSFVTLLRDWLRIQAVEDAK